jgi:RNA recognition motif-containing protein
MLFLDSADAFVNICVELGECMHFFSSELFIKRYSIQPLLLQVDLMKLLIRNLARSTTESELRAMFEEHGTVQSCVIVMDKQTGLSKGFSFVEMPKPGEAKAAMKLLNNQEVGGSKIRVKKAESKQDGGGDE